MKRSGFSLLELLIVTALIPVLALAVFANFNSGIKLWEAMLENSGEEDILIFYEKASENFGGAILYGEIAVRGNPQEFSFAGRIGAPPELGGDRGIGSVRYYYDASDRSIKRETRNLSQIFKERPGTVQTLLGRVGSCRFQYFFENKEYRTFEWTPEWDRPKELPIAVRAVFVYLGPEGSSELVKTFVLPAGGVS